MYTRYIFLLTLIAVRNDKSHSVLSGIMSHRQECITAATTAVVVRSVPGMYQQQLLIVPVLHIVRTCTPRRHLAPSPARQALGHVSCRRMRGSGAF